MFVIWQHAAHRITQDHYQTDRHIHTKDSVGGLWISEIFWSFFHSNLWWIRSGHSFLVPLEALEITGVVIEEVKLLRSCDDIRVLFEEQSKGGWKYKSAFSCMIIFVFWFEFHRYLFPKVQLTIKSTLVQIITWRRTGDKPLFEAMKV